MFEMDSDMAFKDFNLFLNSWAKNVLPQKWQYAVGYILYNSVS